MPIDLSLGNYIIMVYEHHYAIDRMYLGSTKREAQKSKVKRNLKLNRSS